MPETAKPVEISKDPYIANLIAQMGEDVEKILTPEPKAEEQDGPIIMSPPVGSVIPPPAKTEAEIEAERKAEEEKVKSEEAKKAAEATDASTPPPNVPADTRPIIKIVRKETPAPVLPVVPSKKEPTAEELALEQEKEYISTLTPEQQEQITIAQYAEKAGRKGLAKEYIEYFKMVDKKIADNPNLEPEELDTYCKEIKPKVSDREMHKAERAMFSEEAERKAEEKARAIAAPIEREVRALRMQPIIAQTMAQVEEALTNPANKEIVPLPKEVVSLINSDGYEKALEQFPEEAPIVQGALVSAREWINIRNGIVDVNVNDPTHSFLINFVLSEGHRKMQTPESERVRNGKTFVPLNVFNKLMRENPEQAERHYTFTDQEVVELLQNKALADHTSKIKALERAGWKREPKKVSEQPVNTPASTPAAPPENTGSPRAGSRPISGASEAVSDRKQLVANFPHLAGIEQL